jgi:transcriptional regulator with XRE-family HTH domain
MRGVGGSLILDARIRTGLTQRELARRAHTSASAINAYESGRRNPTVSKLQEILLAAGFDIRVRLEPHDSHDEVLARWLEHQPPGYAETLRSARNRYIRRAAVGKG